MVLNISKPALLFLTLLCLLVFNGCNRPKTDTSQSASSEPRSLAEGSVQCIHNPDGTASSYFDVVMAADFPGELPNDITSISITGPGGPLAIDRHDFNYYSKSRVFWIKLPGEPLPGTYTFKVVGGGVVYTSSDIQSENKPLQLAAADSFLPAAGATVYPNDATFSWDGGLYFRVRNTPPAFYQLRIHDRNGVRVFSSNFVKGLLSYHLPEGVLKPGREYEYQVRAADAGQWVKIQNLSSSRRIRFKIAKSLDYRYQVPEKLGDGWEVSSLENAGIDRDGIKRLMTDLIQQKIINVHSLLLVKNGKLVLEEYLHGYTRERKHPTASMAKSITSILIGIAIDHGAIPGVDRNVYTFFPGQRGTAWVDRKYDIRLKDILTMSAGTDCDEISYLHPDPRNSDTRMYRVKHPIAYILNHKVIAPPGKIWNYNSGITVLLGGIIKNTTGLPADRYAEKVLFGPLGISDFTWFRHPDGTVYMHGDLLLRPRDMAKIGLLMLNDGRWKEKRIVSKKWVEESTAGKIDTGRGIQYGYQWRAGKITIDGRTINGYWASGMGGQKIYVFPKLDLVVVMTSQVHNNMPGHDRNESELANYILPAILPSVTPRKAISLDPGILDSYTGNYRIASKNIKIPHFLEKIVIPIIRKGNDLFFKMPDGESVRIFPLSPNEFFFYLNGVGKYQARVIRDRKGKVEGIVRRIGFREVTLILKSKAE